MSKKLQLSIPKPCHENWDAMSPVEQGKFCGSCQKQVVDFSNMSDRQVAEFFKKPSTGSVCGRFMSDQLERDIEIPKKRIPWVKYFFSIALPAFFISKASAQQKIGKVIRPSSKDTIRVPITSEIRTLGMVLPTKIEPVVKDTVPPLTGTVAVVNQNQKGEKGTVIDAQSGKPLVGASILMISTIGKENYVSDRNGSFVLEIYRKITVDSIQVSRSGYETKVLTLQEFLISDGGKHNIALERVQATMGGITIAQAQNIKDEISVQVKKDTVIKQPSCNNVLRMGKVAYTPQAVNNEIQGRVVDEKGEPVSFASIVTGKPGEGVMADENGYFKIKKSWLISGRSITISSVNHDNKKVVAGEENYENGKMLVQLQTRKMLDEVVVSAMSIRVVGRITMGYTVTKEEKKNLVSETKDTTSNKIITPLPDENKLLVYPNPVSSGSTINLSFQKLIEGYFSLQIINQSGQSVSQRELWIDAEARSLSVDVPNVAAGSYFLILIEKRSGKKYTQKIIIQ